MRTHDSRRDIYYLEPLKNYEYVPAIGLQLALPGFGGLGRPFLKNFLATEIARFIMLIFPVPRIFYSILQNVMSKYI